MFMVQPSPGGKQSRNEYNVYIKSKMSVDKLPQTVVDIHVLMMYCKVAVQDVHNLNILNQIMSIDMEQRARQSLFSILYKNNWDQWQWECDALNSYQLKSAYSQEKSRKRFLQTYVLTIQHYKQCVWQGNFFTWPKGWHYRMKLLPSWIWLATG